MKIVGRKEQPHECQGIGRYAGRYLGHRVFHSTFNEISWLPAGTVVECECGKTWIALYITGTGSMTAYYRREKRRERRKREDKKRQ